MAAAVSLFMTASAAQVKPLELKILPKATPSLEIVLDPKAAPAEEFAAFELQKYLKMVSGIYVPIYSAPVPGKNRPGKILFCLPKSPHFSRYARKAFAKDLAKLKGTDGYAVRRRGKDLYFIADCPKGLLNGVYRFLMKNTDIIWPRPADGLTIYTPRKNLVFKKTDYLDIPKFKIRGWGWNHSRTCWSGELEEYRAKMAFNRPGGPVWRWNSIRDRKLGFADDYITILGIGHNMISTWLPVHIYGKKHPEYYMLVDGKRFVTSHANPCYTHKDVPGIIAARVIEAIKKAKKVPALVTVQNADQGVTCECKECLKDIKLPDGRIIDSKDEAFRSTQFFIFFNKIARMVAKKYPSVQLMTYGYMFTAIPPYVKLEPNILVSYCPYIRNDKEPLNSKSNAKWWRRTNNWLKVTKNLQLREYYYSGARFPRPLAEIMVQDLRFLQKNGIPSVTSEFTWSDDTFEFRNQLDAHYFWDLTAGEVWILNQLLWDPFQDVTALRNDFLARTYREGAKDMGEFYRLIREAWLNDPRGSAFNDDIVKSFGYYILKKKLDAPCLAALQKALKAVKHPAAKIQIQKALSTFKKYLGEAKVLDSAELRVPFIKTKEFPGFDLENGVWKKAAKFPTFSLMYNKKLKTRFPMTLKVFHNGRSLYLGTFVKKELLKGKPSPKKDFTFPDGDHLEFFFVNNKDYGYYHLAWNLMGALYDARATDPSWNGKWEVKVEKRKDGWKSVARIPFDTMGFTLQQRNKLSSLIFISSSTEKKQEYATWGGGKVHSVDSFGELILDLE